MEHKWNKVYNVVIVSLGLLGVTAGIGVTAHTMNRLAGKILYKPNDRGQEMVVLEKCELKV